MSTPSSLYLNMRFSPRDFIKLITNLDVYIKTSIVFVESDKNYPVGMLGDIVIEFVHYNNRSPGDGHGTEVESCVYSEKDYQSTKIRTLRMGTKWLEC